MNQQTLYDSISQKADSQIADRQKVADSQIADSQKVAESQKADSQMADSQKKWQTAKKCQ